MHQGEMVGRFLDMGFSKILPEAKSVFIQMYNFFIYLFICYLPEEVKRNVQKFHVLTEKENIEKKSYLQRGNDSKSLFTRSSGPFPWLPFTFPADVCRFFTPRLFGCSPPPSPPASSPPLKSRPPSRPSSSCLACLKKR